MIFSGLDVTVDTNGNGLKEWYCSANIRSERNKDEVIYSQMVLSLETEIMIVPKSYYNIINKFHDDIFDMIIDKYPEIMV